KLLCVTGNGIFKLFKYDTENILKTVVSGLGKREKEPYLAHAWLDKDQILISNENGDLFIVENAEFKTMLSHSPSNGLSINAIQPLSRGFVCGGENGIVLLFEATDDKEMYKKTKTLKIDG